MNGSVPKNSYYVSDPSGNGVSYDDLWCTLERSPMVWEGTPYPWWVYFDIGDIDRILHITYFIYMYTQERMKHGTHSVVMLSIEKQPSPVSLNSSQWILVHNSSSFEAPETAPKHLTKAMSSLGFTYRPRASPITAAIYPPKLARYAGVHTDYMPNVYNHPDNVNIGRIAMFTFDIIIQGEYHVRAALANNQG